jgi:hypothetical protein
LTYLIFFEEFCFLIYPIAPQVFFSFFNFQSIFLLITSSAVILSAFDGNTFLHILVFLSLVYSLFACEFIFIIGLRFVDLDTLFTALTKYCKFGNNFLTIAQQIITHPYIINIQSDTCLFLLQVTHVDMTFSIYHTIDSGLRLVLVSLLSTRQEHYSKKKKPIE